MFIATLFEGLLHITVPVFFIEGLQLLGQIAILHQGRDVQLEVTDQVVACDDVFVPRLDRESVTILLGRCWDLESPVEATFACLASPMGVGQVVILWVEESSHKNVACAFPVHALDIFGVPNDKTHFVIF